MDQDEEYSARSYAFVIINDNKKYKLYKKIIKETLYSWDVHIQFLIDQTGEEIQDSLIAFSEGASTNIVDIMIIIIAPSLSFREYKTKTGLIDLYRNILPPLYINRMFTRVKKIILVNEMPFKNDSSNPRSKIYIQPKTWDKPYSSGAHTNIIFSRHPEFIEIFMPALTRFQGNINNAMRACKDYIYKTDSTDAEITCSTFSQAALKAKRPIDQEFCL